MKVDILAKKANGMSVIETHLLYLGLVRFGFYDISSIRAYYLPTRTVSQLRTRIASLKPRGNSESQPIKVFFVIFII
jgi:hypothetical protein